MVHRTPSGVKSILPPISTPISTPIKTEWVQQIAGTPSGLVQTGPAVLYAKEGYSSDLQRSKIVNMDRRLGGDTYPAAGKFVRFPRMSASTGRLMDTEEGPDLSQRHLDDRRNVNKITLPYDYTEQHHIIGKIPPLQVHVTDELNGNLGQTFIPPHDPKLRDPSAPYARTRNGRESRHAIPLEQGGMFVCELDRAAMDGALLRCIAGETYTIGVSLRYGYGASKTGTDLDRQMLEDWMHKLGGLSAYLTGPQDIPCNCTHVSEGAYAFAFSANVSGAYDLWIYAGANPIPGSPFAVQYLAAPPHARGCTVVGLGLWSSMAGEEARFEWTAKDRFGNFVERGGHPFTVSMYGPEEITIHLTDHNNGKYEAMYRPTIAGQHRVSVQLGDDHLPGSPFLVNVKEGGGDAMMTTVTGEGLEPCTVGSDRHFLVEAVDRFGNRVLHGGEKFEAELRGPVPDRVHLIDMDDGTYAGTFMCRWSGQFALYITLDGTPAGKSPYMISVKPGPTLAQNCECTLVKMPMSRLVCIAGNPCSFLIFAKDRFGNQRDEGGDEFNVRCRGPADAVGAVVTDNKDGSYLAEFTCFKDGDYFVDVKLDRIDIIQSPFVLTVDPAKTEPKCCVAEGVESEYGNGLKGGEAGRPLRFFIQAMDKFGNRVSAPGDNFQITITEVIEHIRVRAKVVDQGDGSYEVTWTGMIRGEYDIHAYLHEEEIKDSPWKVMITTGKPSAEKCTAEGQGLGGAFAGTPASILIETNDHYGNVVTKGHADIKGTIVSVDGKYLKDCDIEDHEDGTYTLFYTAEIMGDYFLAVKVENEHIHESPFLVFVDHTDSDPLHCIADGRHDGGDGLRSCVAGIETGFVISCADRFNNKVSVGGDSFTATLRGAKEVHCDILDHQDGHYTCSYTAIWAGLYKLHVQLNGEEIKNSPFTVLAEVSPLHPPSCYVHGSGVYSCIAGVESEFHVQAKDRFDNVRPQEDHIEVKVSGPEKVVIMRRYLGDGQYDFFWTANTAGQYEVDVTHNKESLATAPYTVTVGPGLVYPINCIATGQGLKSGAAGELQTFTIQSRDKYGNDRSMGGDRYIVSVSGPSSCEARIRDMDNGKYSVSWSAIIKGTYWIQITLNGEEISGSPFFCEIFPAEVDIGNSTAEGMGLLAVKTYKNSTFIIHSFDKFGNHLDRGGDPWEVEITGTERPDKVVEDNQDGTYTVMYQTQMKGNLQIFIGIRGRDLPECPYDVISDTKVRRREALAKLEKKKADIAARKGKRNSIAEVAKGKGGNDIGGEGDELLEEAPGPKRGTTIFEED